MRRAARRPAPVGCSPGGCLALTLVLVFTLPIALVVVVVGASTAINNRNIQQFEAAFFRDALPPATTPLWQKTEFGLLEGNGNPCHLRLTQELVTALSPDQVEQHFAGTQLPQHLLRATGRQTFPVRVTMVASADVSPGQARVQVELFSPESTDKGFDPRCH